MAEMDAARNQDDLTAERAAAERVIRECPEVWNRVCYLSDCTFQALATRILEYGQQTRQDALREAARVARNHRDTGDRYTSSNRICVELDRLASEGG